MGMDKIIEKLNQDILSGMTFSVPGETEHARREAFYCSQLEVDFCQNCSLVNYGMDCHNNKIEENVKWRGKSSR